jgi:hypothetical protein
MAVQTKLQVRRDTAANWTTTNPTLASGEIGFETDTLKFKIGNGSLAWNSLSYQNASTSAQNYAQTVGTKTTVLSSATTPYTVVSVNITTSGNPVLVMVSGDAENATAASWVRVQLYRGSTAIGNDVQLEGSAASENSGYAIQFVDAQAAGTYTYSLKVTNIAGGNFNFGENTGPVITAIELNSLAGTANLASNIAGGAAGQLHYQNAANTTTFVSIGSTNNQTLAYNTATNTPYWTTAPNIGAATGTSLNVTGQFTSTFAGAPFVVSNTTVVTNLNADLLDGYNTATTSTANTVVVRDASQNFAANTVTATLYGTANLATYIVGGAAGSLPYQSAANTTTYLARTATNNSTLAFNSSTNAPFWIQPTLSNTYYAATTSAQLAGVISDETGTGVLVFGTTPTITPANAVAATSATQAGYIGMPQISVSANTAILATHAGKHIYTTTTALTHTIPANSNVAFEIGTAITFITAPSVSLSIAITTDTLRLANSSSTGTRTLAANGVATAIKVTSNVWIMSGNGLT